MGPETMSKFLEMDTSRLILNGNYQKNYTLKNYASV